MKDIYSQRLTELLNRIGNGDDKAVAELYRHYHGFVYAYLRHRLADEQAAEEVVQDVFLAVCKRPAAYGHASKFSTWLCSIAKYKAMDWLRRHYRELPVAELEDDTLQAIEDPNADFVAHMQEAESEDAMKLCIDALPDDQRDAIFWAYYEDADMASIAEWQKCPVGTVKSRLSNARRKMKDCLSRSLPGGHHG